MRSGGALTHHVLIAAANIRRDDFQNDAVVAFTRSQRQLGEVDRLNFDFPRTHVGEATIGWHSDFLLGDYSNCSADSLAVCVLRRLRGDPKTASPGRQQRLSAPQFAATPPQPGPGTREILEQCRPDCGLS